MKTSRYNIGQVVKHKTHRYSAVIVDVDGFFQPSGHMNPHTAQKEFTKPGPRMFFEYFKRILNMLKNIIYIFIYLFILTGSVFSDDCNTTNCKCYFNDEGFCLTSIPDASCTPYGTCSHFCSYIPDDDCPGF